MATILAAKSLVKAMEYLGFAFFEKAVEFKLAVKMGRTQCQDAVPMTLGQELNTYAVTLGEDRARLNAPAGYAELARTHLAGISGLPLVTSLDLIEVTQDVGAFVHLSGIL